MNRVEKAGRPKVQLEAATIADLTARLADAEARGAELVIAYHAAICSPKGVVPDDRFYDQQLAAATEGHMVRARTALTGAS